MKYLKIDIQSIKIKGDEEDEESLRADVFERLQSMIESETLTFTIDPDFEDEDD